MYLGTQLFTDSEYDQRLTRVRELMDRQGGLSAIIVTDPANIFYLIGYNAWSFYTPQMLFVPIEGEMVFYAREMDARGAHRTTWLADDQIVGYPESYVHRPHVHPFDWVAWSLRQRHAIAPASRGGVRSAWRWIRTSSPPPRHIGRCTTRSRSGSSSTTSNSSTGCDR